MNEVFGRTCRAISVLPSGLRGEPEDAQLLVPVTGLGDARHPRDGRLAHWAAAELPLVGDSFWPVVAFRGWQQSANSVEKVGSSRLPAY